VQITVGHSVSQSVLALSPSGTHDHILVIVETVAVLSVVGSCRCWPVYSNICFIIDVDLSA